MKRFPLKRMSLVMILFVLAPPVFAEREVPESPFTAGSPIETRMDFGVFGLLGGGMRYRVDGRPISRYEDFQCLILPLRDEEATRLLNESQECHFAAWILYVSGGAVGVDVGVSFKPMVLLGVDWFDRIATGLTAAEVFWTVGALLDGSGEARKFNAVQRYNQLLKEKDQAFLELGPRLQWTPGGMILALQGRF